MLVSRDSFALSQTHFRGGLHARYLLSGPAFICGGGSGEDKNEKEIDEEGAEKADRTRSEPREKTLTEVFDDLETEDQETVDRLLDRMIGRKK